MNDKRFENTKLPVKHVWHGRYNDVALEIAHWGASEFNQNMGVWNYYVRIHELQLSPEDFSEFWLSPGEPISRSAGYNMPSYDYYKARWSDVDWHGGVTFYTKETGIDGAPRGVKIGCDYNHLFDEGRGYDYDIAYVEREAQRTIDQIRNLYKFKRPCSWSGEYVFAEDGIEKDGRFYSKRGLASREEWDAKRAA